MVIEGVGLARVAELRDLEDAREGAWTVTSLHGGQCCDDASFNIANRSEHEAVQGAAFTNGHDVIVAIRAHKYGSASEGDGQLVEQVVREHVTHLGIRARVEHHTSFVEHLDAHVAGVLHKDTEQFQEPLSCR